MNHVFRIVWSYVLQAWVVTSELSKRRGKRSGGVDKRVAVTDHADDRILAETGPPMAWPLRLAIVLALAVQYAPARAADRYWDVNGTAVGSGGTGTWNTTNTFWSPNNDGVSGPFGAWNNAALDNAFFGGTAGTVTLSGAISVHNLTFQTDGYTLTGGSLTLGGTSPTITVTTGTSTIASSITSTSGLTKAGAGTLTLNGSNTFNGGIDINGGTLTLGAANDFIGTINATGGNLNLGTIGDPALGNIGNVLNLGNGRTLTSTGTISANRTINLVSGLSTINGAGTGGAFYTGAGGLTVGDGISLTNDANNYTGQTRFTTATNWGGSYNAFSSIGDLGEASALGAPTTVANGTIVIGRGGGQDLGATQVYYTGSGDSSNRNWQMNPGAYAGAAYLHNAGSGTLRLTGNITATGAGGHAIGFLADSADMEVLGVISGNNHPVQFSSRSGRTIRLGTANTFDGQAQITGEGTVEAALLSDAGVAGSLGIGSISISSNGTLAYVGAGESSNKNWTINNGTLANNGTGALTLGGTVAITNTASLGGSFTGAQNVVSGVVSGTGNLRSTGDGTWLLTGANTYTGQTIVDSGVLRAGTADAFGASSVFVVNGGTLDMNGFDRTVTRLSGTGGTLDLGSANLTIEAASGTASYAGSIAGSGDLIKRGASTQTLTGASTYTGDTRIEGGTLVLDFSAAGGPTSNIIGNDSALDMSGGTLSVTGAAGESNTQTFDGLFVTGGNNTISASSGSGGSVTIDLGTITRTGGLMNFELPDAGSILTSNADMFLAWATVNNTDYAKVEDGHIRAFLESDYTDQDDASLWASGQVISDSDGDTDGYFGTVTGSVQLGGLQYTMPVSTTVTVTPGNTLGVDAPIIVAPSVLNTDQLITGGMITGGNGTGDALTVQQNGTGNFTIASQIVDNGNNLGFVKSGEGVVRLTNMGNSYTGGTKVLQGTLAVDKIADGGLASSIGASSADAANLLLQGSTLRYSGTGDTSDRGFTIARSGGLGATIEVNNSSANLVFSGLVTSPDDAGLTKTGGGRLTLANSANDYTGVTTVNGGLLSVNTLTNGGIASGIGAASAASSNLVLNGGGLQYTGATTSTNRGFTLGANGTGGGTVDVSNAATTLTVSGNVVGTGTTNQSGRLTKDGAGTLVLSGTANTFLGGIAVNGGILRAGATNAFGGATNASTNLAAGTTLDLNNFDNRIGPLFGSGNITLGSGTLRIASGDGTYSGAISGTGGVWRTDGGTQTFNGCNNTYTGATTLQGANLRTDCLADGGLASGIGASGAGSTNLVFNNGSLLYTGASVSIDRGFQLQGSGTIQVTSAGTTLEFGGSVIGGGTLIKRDAGTLVLSGTNTYTGNTRVEGGTLRAGTTNAFGPQGHMTLNNTAGVLLDLDGFNTVVTSLIGGGTTGGNIDLGSATLTINSVDNRSYAGVISGTGNLVKNGTGLQALSSCNNAYTGTTTINAGTLQVTCLEDGGLNSSIGASSADPANLIINGGTLLYSGAGSSTDRRFTLSTNGGTLDASGNGVVQFTNTGAVALTGSNVARTLTLTGTNTGDNLFSGQLNNNGTGVTSLTKTGTGTWRLSNNSSTYTGVTRINGGVLSVDQMANGGQASSIGAATNAAANLVIGNGSTLRYTGAGDSTDRRFTLDTGTTFIESSGTGALQFTNTGAVTLTGTNTARTIALGGTNTGDNTLGGTIGDNGTGKTTLAKNDSGTWILTGNNTFTGNTVINDGNLVIGNGGTTGNAGAGDVIINSETSVLSLNRSDTFTFDGTLMCGPVACGTLAQIGTGTSVLTSLDNEIAATVITAGTLQVDGGLETPTIDMSGTSALTVNGTVQTDTGGQAALTGDAGDQTITVGAGGNLLASGDLGDGSDTIDLTGTLDTGNGSLGLGDGDDTLVLHDGAEMLGSGVNAAGAGGTDTLVVDTALGFTLDGGDIDTFDILTKQNTGLLVLTGDHDFGSGTAIDGGVLQVLGSLETPTVSMADNTQLLVSGGTLEADGGDPATITGSAGSNLIQVTLGGTLRADGDLGDGVDSVLLNDATLDTGAGVLALGDGDDFLNLQDGAVLEGGGVDAGTGNDTLQLLNNDALVFDGSQTEGFERLNKLGAGTATMTGSQDFSAGTGIFDGTLDVDGTLETPTITLADDTALNVDGTVQAVGGTTATITGSAGDNTVSVGADGTLLASGDLGTGNDVLDVAGLLDTGAGTFALGDGDDTLTIHENTNIIGTVSAGAGNDTLDTHIDSVADLGAVQGFETLSKTGTGELNINGLLSSDFSAVNVLEGTLDITAGGIVIAAPGSTLDTFVASGATLNVDGSFGCGDGDDSMTVAGIVSGSSAIDMCDGADTLTLQDGAVLDNAISGGLGSDDTLVLDNATALTFDATNTTDFELLQKDNTGTATLTGTQSFLGGTTINGGTLDVDGALETPTIALADDTTLNVDGSVDAGPADPTLIAGSTGSNTISVGSGGTLVATGDLGDGDDTVLVEGLLDTLDGDFVLGDGTDTLDVAGTLDLGTGTFFLGDGDDNFVVHDGTAVTGTIDGGAGLDTRVYDIDLNADLGALVNFEGVTKTGTGTLNINGPGATDLQQVQVLEGVLDVHAGASIVATPGSALDTAVASGATLNVDGDYGCGDGNDTMTVSGTVSGSGTVNLCAGDDTLTLNDGADIAGLANPIDGDAGDDRVVLDNASGFTLDGSDIAGFEILEKDNTGEATLTGNHAFTGGSELNGGTLMVAGTLETPTLTMADDTMLEIGGFAGGGPLPTDSMTITGSSGTNTVIVDSGAVLRANGSLGDGDDVLDVAGNLDVSGGGTFDLGDGDDTFTIHDGTQVVGTVDGGAGQDIFNPDIDGVADLGALNNFEVLTKSGVGVLNVNGPGASGFDEVNVLEGTLNIGPAGGIENVQDTLIASGAMLNVDGTFAGSDGDDTMTVAGTVTGSGTIDLGDGADTFTIQDGAELSGLATPVSGGLGIDTFVADLAGSAVLGGAVEFETLTKTNTGTLHVDGPALSAFSTVNVLGGTLDIGIDGEIAGVQNATVASGATLNVDGDLLFTPGDDLFTVAGTVTGTSTIDMLDGDDTLVIQDGADLSGLAGPVDGGTGSNTLVTDIAGSATLGGVTNFQTLDKTNVGTLHIDGPAASDFTTVNVEGGTLDVGVDGDVSGVVATTVSAGATMHVDGSFQGSAGDDAMDVSGTVSGNGLISLADGDDTLILHDGAVLAAVVDGGAHGAGDTVVLDNAGALSFDASNTVNFEFLSKTNTGTATLAGAQTFSGGTGIAGGELVVVGALSTPTVTLGDDTALTVDGTLDAGSGTVATITGSDGTNTVTVNGIALATGDLGGGEDVLDIVGTLDTLDGGFALGDGDDSFVVHDGTVVQGTVDGGAGLDTRVYDINLTADLGALVNFEGVTKTGTGVLNINGPGATDLQEVSVLGGILNVGQDASVVAIAGGPLDTVVASGATLHVDGAYGCGDGNDHMTVAGTVAGNGIIDLCGGEDVLTLQDGAELQNVISGGSHGTGDTVVLDTAADFTFDATNTINFEFLQKDNAGEATLVGAQAFIGGTTINGGTLTVAGTLATPTVAMADDTTLNVDGQLDAGSGTAVELTGSAGSNTVTVGADGTLLASGDLGDGNDVLDVAGTLDTLGGAVLLGDGDDTLTIHDDTRIVGTVVAGAGNDTFNADIAGVAGLGAVQQFETLSKTGAGELNVNGPMSSDFTTVNVLGGTLDVTANGSVAAQNTTVAAGATLNIDGSYTGTAGDDTFTSRGTVNGALDFGAGNDTAHFIGGDISGLTAIEGGDGDNVLRFSAQDLDDGNLAVVSQWQRIELLGDTTLSQDSAFDLDGGTLFIDASSQWLADAAASLDGNVENAGLIDVGANRLAISGNYAGQEGALHVTVSPGTLSSGGLDIDGDVTGTTNIVFDSDGTDFTAGGTASILVIDSPNDDTSTAGSFVPDSTGDGVVRLQGSILPWSFGQEADNNWYLNAEAGVLPETPGYAVLPTLGLLAAQNNDNLIHQRLAGVRGDDLPECGARPQWPVERAGTGVIDDCRGIWTAVSYNDVKLGANPGFEVSGEDIGLFVGADSAFDRPGRTLRGGVFLGYRHGNYWTTGVNSTALPGSGIANVDIDTAVGGMYMSHTWDKGGYVNFVLTGQLPHARIHTPDGFSERIVGNSLTLSSRAGHRYELGDGWKLEPQLQLDVSAQSWGGKVDASGKEVIFDDDLIATGRAGLRVEKEIARANGGVIRPWATLAVQRVMGQNRDSVSLAPVDGDSQAFPNHDLGTSATLDIGFEATFNQRVSAFGVLSLGQELDGTDYQQAGGYLGMRVRW
ncbi:autotransporter-associated beta strand repeat-containing protein [Lysobacter yangpyeongensis]|uniref:Autotransporter-associated beta strand repeat-containing protein n=1 Tax=Lysobacter yangpyeongensis TaxID=346182 RepID=A0ABW0SJ06_9GAMM